MALTRTNLAVVTQSATNTHKWKLWLYESAGDALATILGAGYFGSVVVDEVIETNDLILCIGTDGVTLGRFTSVTSASNIIVSDLSTGGGAQAAITSLTDSTGGTADNTLADLADGTTYATDHAAIENNFADLAAKINAILVALRAAGVIAT